MRLISIPCIVMASINFAVGIYYLYFFYRRTEIKEHLPFALLCLSVGMYDVFSVGLYNAVSVSEGIVWQRLQLGAGVVVSIFITWFSGIFIWGSLSKTLKVLIVWFILFLIASFFVPPEISLSISDPAVKHIVIGQLPEIVYYEGSVGWFYNIEIFTFIAAYFYLMLLFVRHFRQNHNRKTLLIIIVGFLAYFCGVLNDSFVAMQMYGFIYLSEYSFSIIIIGMAYILLNKFVDLHLDYEELNKNLEHKVMERTSEIEKLNQDLQRMAEHDDLTGIYNRRFFNEYFDIEVRRARNWIEHKSQLGKALENDMNFGIAIIDIDFFKTINDTYGHAAGDMVLKKVVELMNAGIFTRDVLCRYGGDEFVLLLTKTSNHGIYQAVEKIRKSIEEHCFTLDNEAKDCLHVTISVGLVNLDEVLEVNPDAALRLADERLLRAKSLGRNRVVYQE
jgi:diguanylate cyclase (GGDEF)-like protein